MCPSAPLRVLFATVTLAAMPAEVLAQGVTLDWRHIGNSAIEEALPSVATGPADRVWFSVDGATLYVHTVSGRIFQTADFEQWKRVQDPKSIPAPPDDSPAVAALPEANLKVRGQMNSSGRVYAV